MKKLLVVLLAVVMVFGFAGTALAADSLGTAYSDLSGQDQTVTDAFMKLSALDVFGGYTDGTIHPDSNITRAEFAKVACTLAGMADSADVLKNNASKYSDVAAGQWYTGYVNLATSQGYVSGYSDGTFKPNNNISMQEALTVLLRIAGYTDNLTGPWPLNYIAQGGKLDVTDDVTFAGSSACTRAAVAVMAANVLDVDVVYWDTDKEKFVEDTDSDDDTLTVLQDKFGAYTDEDVLFDANTWGFDDFDEQEVYLNYDGENEYGDELAETYWVSGGLNIGNLSNAMGDLILNDDKEIVYIDVTSTTAYSDDLTITISDGDTGDSDTEAVVDSVTVDDDDVKLADTVYLPEDADVVNDDTAEYDYSAAKLYYNDDNKVYMVEDVAGTGSVPGIFETYNTSKNRITFYDDCGSTYVDMDDDVALLKDGLFITASDLTDGDLLNEVGTADGSDATYIVTSFSEGELTKGSASTVTIGGNTMTWTDDGDITADASYYSDDAMESFNDFTDIDNMDAGFDTTVKYATKLGNPYDLDLVVFSGEATSYVYGIITDVDANINDQVASLTILGSDGEEVDYDLVKGDDNGRPSYLSYTAMDGVDDSFDLTFGSYIKAKVSDNGTIDTDDIVALIDPIAGNWDEYNGDDDVVYNTADGNMLINSNRIKLDGVYYTLNESTLVFQTSYADDEFNEGEVVDVADLEAADEITSGSVFAFVDDGVVKQIFMLDTDLNGSDNFGVLDDIEYRSGDWYATLLDGSEYTINDDDYADLTDQVFFRYKLSDGDLTPYTYDLVTVDDDNDVTCDGRALNTSTDGYEMLFTSEDLVNATSSRVELNGEYYDITDDTLFYYISDGEITEGDIYDIEAGDTPVIAITTDDPDDYELLYVFVIDGEDDDVTVGDDVLLPETVELGAMESSAAAVDEDGEWFVASVAGSSSSYTDLTFTYQGLDLEYAIVDNGDDPEENDWEDIPSSGVATGDLAADATDDLYVRIKAVPGVSAASDPVLALSDLTLGS